MKTKKLNQKEILIIKSLILEKSKSDFYIIEFINKEFGKLLSISKLEHIKSQLNFISKEPVRKHLSVIGEMKKEIKETRKFIKTHPQMTREEVDELHNIINNCLKDIRKFKTCKTELVF